MFNAYIWKNYLRAGGSDIVSTFENNLVSSVSDEYIKMVSRLRKIYCPDRRVIKQSCQQLRDLARDIKDDFYLIENGIYTITSAIEHIFENMLTANNGSDHDAFLEFSESIDYFTSFLAMELPEFFIPWYFKYNFNFFMMIAREFGIELPHIPAKKDYRGRFFYYGELCKSLSIFREKHALSPYELCAFLYDFAPNCIGGKASYIITSLPEPKHAFLIGGSQDDIFLTNDTDQVVCWQGNPDSLAGDMAIMYLRSPVSAIDSLWQIVSIGFNDPFFYYYRCVYIKKVKAIKRMSLKQLRQDEIFGRLSIVRKNMQGVNGVEIPPSAYNYLLELSFCDLPRLQFFGGKEHADCRSEREVEDKLIKPFLEKLGYAKEEYQQQLYIEIGNHNFALIPDFVILPVFFHDHYSAYFLLEAKLSITSAKQLASAKKQAGSYARQLGAAYCVVASQQGIWVSSAHDGYQQDVIKFSWAELGNEDNFSQLFKLIGNTKSLRRIDTASARQ
ncbi:hypothetical protein [uncultured Desulfovibrio sp.]|nr:hypothetical protein [uncultured Desulfovibrio sp.]